MNIVHRYRSIGVLKEPVLRKDEKGFIGNINRYGFVIRVISVFGIDNFNLCLVVGEYNTILGFDILGFNDWIFEFYEVFAQVHVLHGRVDHLLNRICPLLHNHWISLPEQFVC